MHKTCVLFVFMVNSLTYFVAKKQLEKKSVSHYEFQTSRIFSPLTGGATTD